MRKVIILLAAFWVFLASLSAVLATSHARDVQLRGYVDATQDANLPYRVPLLGVNADLLQYSSDELDQHLQWMSAAHITWIRQVVDWSQFEPQQGIYDWSAWDSIIEALRDYPQLRLVVVVMNSPDWARSSDVLTAPPDEAQSIRGFLRAFASRYSEAIDYYQIWDEPNLYAAWGNQDPRPADYAALLAEAYQTIHSADADATVIAAALAPTTEISGQNSADIVYLRSLYQSGASAYFDAIAAKPYGFNDAPDERTVSIDRLNFSRIIAMREIMLEFGDGKKALWASNWGWNHLPADWQGSPSIWGAVSQTEQIQYTLGALERAEGEWAWLGGMILQQWQPNLPNDDPQWGFALINQENQASPLWQALLDRPQAQGAINGLYHPLSNFARYSGVWQFSPLGADIGWLETSDSQVEFDFVGRDIALLLREGDYFAFLYPRIDGQAANATPHDNQGNAYLLLRSGSRVDELNLVPVAENLSHAAHTLSLIADKGWDRWALAGFAVSSGNRAEPYERQIFWAWVSTLIAGIATVISAYRLDWTAIKGRFSGVLAYVDSSSQMLISLITSLALMLSVLLTWGQADANIFRRDVLPSVLAIGLSAGLVVYELPFILSVIAALLLFVLIYRQLQLGLLLIILYAPFFLFPVELYRFAFPMSELLLLITFGAWILKHLTAWGAARQTSIPDYPLRLNLKFNGLDYAVLAWCIIGTLSLTWAERLDPALTEFRSLILEPSLFYLMLRTSQTKAQDVLRLVYGLVSAGLLVAVIGLIYYLRGDAIITAEDGARRLASVYGSPNNVGLFLGRCIPFSLILSLASTSRKWQILSGVALLLMLLAALLTQSVGALVFGLPVGLTAVILLKWRWKALPFVALLGVLGIVVVMGLSQVSARFASRLDLSTGTNFIRLRVWESSLEIIREHPLTGLGLDQFLYEYRGAYVRPDAIFDPDLSHPHNIILDFWIRLGVLGLGVLAWTQFHFWRISLKIWRTNQQSVLIIGAMAAMAALLTHGLIDNSVYVHDLVYVYLLLLAIPSTSSAEV